MKFYTLKENSQYYWLDCGENKELTALNADLFNNKDITIINLEKSILKGVHVIYTSRVDWLFDAKLSPAEYAELQDLYNLSLETLTLQKVKELSLQVLNKTPYLWSATCMRWKTYPVTKDDPNFFSGSYRFPDGNIYTIVKCRQFVDVYFGEGDHCLMMNEKKNPLVKYKINLDEWAAKIDNVDEKSIITEVI